MGMSRPEALLVNLAPGLTLMLKIKNRSPKPEVGTVVRHGDDFVFVVGHRSARTDDHCWYFRRVGPAKPGGRELSDTVETCEEA